MGKASKYAGFINDEGSVGAAGAEGEHLAIVTYWKSFDQHETSHADDVFKEKFSALADMCTETKELGYGLLWQANSEITETERKRGHPQLSRFEDIEKT